MIGQVSVLDIHMMDRCKGGWGISGLGLNRLVVQMGGWTDECPD